MNTTDNTAVVVAKSIRHNVATLRRIERRIDDDAAELRQSAFAQLVSAAEQLESTVAPDPDARCEYRVRGGRCDRTKGHAGEHFVVVDEGTE